MKIKKRGETILAVLRHAIAIALSLTVVTPLYVMLINSFKNKREGNLMRLSFPTRWFPENYQTVIEQGKLVRSFFNSCLYAVAGSVLVVFIISLATWILARRRDKLSKALYFFMIVGLFLPVNYVTLVRLMTSLGIFGSQISVILYYIGANAAFCTFICYGYFSNVPRELDEAAIVDGVSPFRTFVSVIFPLLKPITVTAFVLTFISIWSDFTTPLYLLPHSSAWPMNLAVYNFFGRYSQQWNLVFADIVLTVFPVLIIYLFCQKQIVGGLTSGSVKG